MFSELKTTIISKESFPTEMLSGIEQETVPLLRRSIEAAENYTGYNSNFPLRVYFKPTYSDISASLLPKLGFNGEVWISLDISLKLPAAESRMLAYANFSHELGHFAYDFGNWSNALFSAFTEPCLKGYSHHIEYRADAFAQKITPQFAQTKAEMVAKGIILRGDKDTNIHPSDQKFSGALERRSYDDILDRNNSINAASLKTSGKRFDSFVDYIKNRGHYKEVQASINAL